MSSCSERQTGVEHYVHGGWVRHVSPARADPQALAETHWVEVIHPLTLPVFVFQLLDFMCKTFAQQRFVFQHGDHGGHIRFRVIDRKSRRVGKECRSRCDWSSDVCSSDLQSLSSSCSILCAKPLPSSGSFSSMATTAAISVSASYRPMASVSPHSRVSDRKSTRLNS